MPTLRFLLSWFGPIAPILGLVWSLVIHTARRRPALLREADMTDWLLRDIGRRDGRDTTVRRMRRDDERSYARRRDDDFTLRDTPSL